MKLLVSDISLLTHTNGPTYQMFRSPKDGVNKSLLKRQAKTNIQQSHLPAVPYSVFLTFQGSRKQTVHASVKELSGGNNDKSEKGIKECYKELCIAPMILLGRGGRGRGKQREDELECSVKKRVRNQANSFCESLTVNSPRKRTGHETVSTTLPRNQQVLFSQKQCLCDGVLVSLQTVEATFIDHIPYDNIRVLKESNHIEELYHIRPNLTKNRV